MSTSEKRGGRAKTVFIIITLVLIGALAWFVYAAKSKADEDRLFTFECNSERVAFLNSLGYIVEPDPEKENIIIPAEFNAAYSEYNELQRSQGFDLEPYKGKEAVKLTYRILNFPDYPENIFINMILDDHRLIGADITYNDAENGFTRVLIPDGYRRQKASETASSAEQSETESSETEMSETETSVTETEPIVTEPPASETTPEMSETWETSVTGSVTETSSENE